MTMPLPYGGIQVVVQRAEYDRWNDATYTDHHVIDGCLEYPTGSTETNGAVTDNRALLVPVGSDIRHTDRIRMRGVTFQVEGLPKEWTDPFTGWAPGMEVVLRRVT